MKLVVLLLIASATFAVYGRILGHEFLVNWDDNIYVTANEAAHGFTFSHLRDAFSSFYVGNYAPLHIASYMLDYSFWGMNPKGYLLSGIVIHACNGFLAYRLFLLLDGRQTVALVSALIFLLHPVQVESVAWISERKTLLAMFFSLLTLHAYVRFKSCTPVQRRRWYLLCLAAFVSALLSKAIAVVIPLVVIAYDFYAGGWQEVRKGVADKIPLLFLALGLAIVTVIGQRSDGCLVPYLNGNPLNNALTMMPVFLRYLGLIFWPAQLSPIYAPPIKTALDLEVLLSFMVFLAAFSFGIYLLNRRKLAGLGLAVFFLGLLPVSHIFPIPTLMQDRYLYFPLLGFSLFAVTWVSDTAYSYAGAKGSKVVTAVALFLTLVLAYNAARQAGIWRNAEQLWSHTTKVVPRSRQAWIMLATTRHESNDFSGAEEAYLKLLEIAPKEPRGLNGIGTLYGEKGNIEKSLHYLRLAAEVSPNDPDTLLNFGYATFLNGDLEGSLNLFHHALAVKPQLLPKLLPTLLDIANRQNDRKEAARLKALAGESLQGR